MVETTTKTSGGQWEDPNKSQERYIIVGGDQDVPRYSVWDTKILTYVGDRFLPKDEASSLAEQLNDEERDGLEALKEVPEVGDEEEPLREIPLMPDGGEKEEYKGQKAIQGVAKLICDHLDKRPYEYDGKIYEE